MTFERAGRFLSRVVVPMGGLPVPVRRLGIILRYSVPATIKISEEVLGVSLILTRSLPVPLCCFGTILRHPVSILVRPSERMVSLREALFCGPTVPLRRFHVVSLHSISGNCLGSVRTKNSYLIAFKRLTTLYRDEDGGPQSELRSFPTPPVRARSATALRPPHEAPRRAPRGPLADPAPPRGRSWRTLPGPAR